MRSQLRRVTLLTTAAVAILCSVACADVEGLEGGVNLESGQATYKRSSDINTARGSEASSEISRDIYIFAGQSNMEGFGDYNEVSDTKVPNNIRYFRKHRDSPLINDASNFRSNREFIYPYMGPEYQFLKRLSTHSPHLEHVAIKYAWGGTTISEWREGNDSYLRLDETGEFRDKNLFENLVEVFEEAKRKTGVIPRRVYFFWMQGESDGLNPQYNNELDYITQFERFKEELKNALDVEDIKITMGLINSGIFVTCPYLKPILPDTRFVNHVRNDQFNIGFYDENVEIVPTETLDCRNSDDTNIHFNTTSQIKLGNDFFDAHLKFKGEHLRSEPQKVYRFMNNDNHNWMLSISPNEVRGNGWVFEGEAFQSRQKQIPVYRCYRPNVGKHFTSIHSNCEGVGIADGVLFHGDLKGKTPVWRCYHRILDSHLTTVNKSECETDSDFIIDMLTLI